jgi:hypothetical protein
MFGRQSIANKGFEICRNWIEIAPPSSEGISDRSVNPKMRKKIQNIRDLTGFSSCNFAFSLKSAEVKPND